MAKNQRTITQKTIESKEQAKPESKTIDFSANEALKRTSMYSKRFEFYPTLSVDFSEISLNQPNIPINTDELESFIKDNKIYVNCHVWLSDGHDRILGTLNLDGEAKIITIHWLIRQTVVVNGDLSDL